MLRWNQELSSLDIESGAFIFHGVVESGTAYEITINMAGSNSAMLGRSLGCIMIGFMPEEGLEESLNCLRGMLEFYNHKPMPRRAAIAPKAIGATIAGKKKRPDLVIT